MDALLSYASSSGSDSEHDSPAKRRKLGSSRQSAQTSPAAAAKDAEATEQQQQVAQQADGNGSGVLPADCQPPRVRRFPHVDGNWPAITYIAVSDPGCLQALEALAAALLTQHPAAAAKNQQQQQESAAATGHDNGSAHASAAGPLPQLWPLAPSLSANTTPNSTSPSADQPPPPQQQQPQHQQASLHLSLSRTVAIRHIQAESLRAALRQQLRCFRSFSARLSGLACLVNEDSSRTFVGLKVAGAGLKQVLRLIEAVNKAHGLHGLPPFHEDPLPHVSLAWAPGDCRQQLEPWLAAFAHLPITLRVHQVTCQIGSAREVVWQGL